MIEIPDSQSPPSSAAFRSAMRLHIGGISVVTVTATDGECCGITATAFCSLSDAPPTLIVCVNRNARLANMLQAGKPFAVNLPNANQQEIARVFGGMTSIRGRARFGCGSWHRGDNGAPILRHARASFECIASELVTHTTHVIVIGTVTHLRVGARANGALAYVDGRFLAVA
ncbi:MAG TPA: flavin reductase family protein [Steroidobacteraceae bacterium]|nr:flavin reductase family protein [Steroidobacteraceae bacterium]